jgi:hypothetical protein
MNEEKMQMEKLKAQGFLIKSKKKRSSKTALRLRDSQLAMFKNEVKWEVSRQLLKYQEVDGNQHWLTQEVAYSREFYMPEHYQELLKLLGRQALQKGKGAGEGVATQDTKSIKQRFMFLLKQHLETDFPHCPGGLPYLLAQGHLLNKQRAEAAFDAQDSTVRGNLYNMEEPESMCSNSTHKLILLEGVRRRLLESYGGWAGERELLSELEQYIQECYV